MTLQDCAVHYVSPRAGQALSITIGSLWGFIIQQDLVCALLQQQQSNMAMHPCQWKNEVALLFPLNHLVGSYPQRCRNGQSQLKGHNRPAVYKASICYLRKREGCLRLSSWKHRGSLPCPLALSHVHKMPDSLGESLRAGPSSCPSPSSGLFSISMGCPFAA